MSEIKELVQVHNEYLNIILFSVIFIMVITFVLSHFTEKIRFPKYLPGLVAFLVGMFIFVSSMPHLYEKAYLDRLFWAMTGIGSGLIGLCFGAILGVFSKKKTKDLEDDEEYEEY